MSRSLLDSSTDFLQRENALAGLQQRVKGLEKTLAKVLDDPSRSGDARPIVNLKTLMTSSPKEDTTVSAMIFTSDQENELRAR